MDLRQLEVFVQVVEQGGFSRAAETLYLAQPTVSAHISALEKELGVQLLERSAKRLELTEAGAALLGHARALLAGRDAALEALRPYRQEIAGQVRVACSSVPGEYYIPRLLARFRQQHPEVAFDLVQTDSAEAAELVRTGRADLGFVGTKPEDPRLLSRAFARDSLAVAMPRLPEYERFLSPGAELRELFRAPFISREPGSGTRRETERFLRQLGVDPGELNIAVEVRSTESILRMVGEGLGIAVLSRSAVEEGVRQGRVLHLEPEPAAFHRNLYALRRRSGPLAPAAQAFLTLVLESCAGHQ